MRKFVVLLALFGVALLALAGVAAAAPQTTIDSGPPATTSSTTATFTFHSSGPPAHVSLLARWGRLRRLHDAEDAHRPRCGPAHVPGRRGQP